MTRKLITAAATALAVVALIACGSSTDAKPAAKTTTPASSRATVIGGTVDGTALAPKMVDAMFASKTAHMTIALDGKPIAEGDVKLTNPVKVAMKVNVLGDNIEWVQVGGVIHMKGIPGTTKPWVKFDPKGTDAFSKAASALGDLSKSHDPRTWVSMMEGASGKDLGTGQVDGVSTRQYAFEIPVSTYGKAIDPESLKELQGVTKAPIAIEYSVGDDNLLRKLTTVITVSGNKVSNEIIFSDWGKPVNIVAPSAAQVGPPPAM